jgi:hypothetical protein
MYEFLHNIHRTAHPERGAVEHMGTYYFVLYVLVAQQLLNGADVLAPLQQVWRRVLKAANNSEAAQKSRFSELSLGQGSSRPLSSWCC